MSLVLVFEYLDSNDCGMYVLWLFDRYPNEPICFWIKFWFSLQMVTSLCIDRSIDRFCRLLLGNDQRPQWPQSELRLKRLIGPQVKDPYNSGDSPVIPKLPLTLLSGQFFLNWESYAKTNLQQKYNFTISFLSNFF